MLARFIISRRMILRSCSLLFFCEDDFITIGGQFKAQLNEHVIKCRIRSEKSCCEDDLLVFSEVFHWLFFREGGKKADGSSPFAIIWHLQRSLDTKTLPMHWTFAIEAELPSSRNLCEIVFLVLTLHIKLSLMVQIYDLNLNYSSIYDQQYIKKKVKIWFCFQKSLYLQSFRDGAN